MFNIESNDIYICRRGCLHPCIPLPCEDIVYPSIWEKLFCRFKRLTALAIFLGLIYATYGLKVWGPTGPALDTVLGDSDNKVMAESSLSNTTVVINAIFFFFFELLVQSSKS